MSNKKEITNPDLNTEEVKDLELDEQPKPTRKVSDPSIPIPDESKSNKVGRNKYNK
ncbi:MAG: hypothetical protein ACR2F1_07725 [Nitrososphaeraceae archaeon]